MNERNVALLYNWLRHNKVAIVAGIWVGIDEAGEPAPEFFRPGDPVNKFNYWCVFSCGVLSGIPELAPSDSDFNTWGFSGGTWLSWVRYLKRVYGLDMADPEYQYVDSFRWRGTVGSNWKAAVHRLKFILDNHGLISSAEVEDVLEKAKVCTYDDI